MNVTIDPNSGFCFGVVYAISMAEEELAKNGKLFCLGDIVHNDMEVERLKTAGLVIINHVEYKKLHDCKVLIRAHGEPPDTYRIALKNNIQLIDASCPVVLKLQNKIRRGFDEIQKKNGQIVIYGKEGHAEVNGLVGQTNSKAIIINSDKEINKIDLTKPVILFSQTTQSKDGFEKIKSKLEKELYNIQNDGSCFFSNDSICRQVSNREPQLRNFSKQHEVIFFVSDEKSANGIFLYNVCKEENQRTYLISHINGLETEWLKGINSVGISGATSTPMWLMEKLSDKILNIQL
ncbi:MAG: 4-hydroxy-3-methylbut-2-enyl diphosphate reductase [Bacteroidota bacterium]|nr:4-hydroxy-3-methylbut-2-enyl diphosphate reductase [Bacteroidota bacterium]